MTTPQPPFVRIPPEFLSLFAGIFKGHIFIGNHRLAQQKKKIKTLQHPHHHPIRTAAEMLEEKYLGC
jgi:hypothetical protein